MAVKALRIGLAAALAGGALLFGVAGAAAQEQAADATEGPYTIPMAGNQFVPPEIVVPVGTTVTWVNHDPEPHDVIAADFVSFESPIINTGERWSLTFSAPGSFAYFCDLHANMAGVVHVVSEGEMMASPIPGGGATMEYDYGY